MKFRIDLRNQSGFAKSCPRSAATRSLGNPLSEFGAELELFSGKTKVFVCTS